MIDQDMLDVDMLVWSSSSSQVSPGTQEKLMPIQHLLDVNMLVWSSNSEKHFTIDHGTISGCYLKLLSAQGKGAKPFDGSGAPTGLVSIPLKP